MSHHFAIESRAATIVCRCGTEQTTSKQGKISAHRGCTFSGKVLKAESIVKRTVQ